MTDEAKTPAARKALQPLRGVRIVDFSQYVPGPFCTLICSRLGAAVVKVERAETGDPLRTLDPISFNRLNAGKKSVALDLKDPDQLARALSLVEKADVLVESFRPGVASRLGIGFDAIHALSPRLTYVSITGFGQLGARRLEPGHDLNYMALGGGLGADPRVPPIQVADFGAGGLYAVIGILSALMDLRDPRSRGRHLDISMTEGVASFATLAEGAGGAILNGERANYTLYETSDGAWLSVGALEAKFWSAFCSDLGRPDFVARLADPDLRKEVAEIIKKKNLGHWTSCFSGQACVVPVSNLDDAVRDEYLRERGQSLSERPWLGRGDPNSSPAPALGADEDEVRRDWGVG